MLKTKEKPFRISCDDGCASDVRLAELCKKYGIECIFYWPANWSMVGHNIGFTPLTYSDALAIAKEFEIGSHTITHQLLTRIPRQAAEQEIVESKQMLKSIFGKEPTKFAPPRGYTTNELTAVTLQHYEEQRLTKGYGLVHIHPKSGVNDEYPWVQYARSRQVTELWCHSYDLDRHGLWDELETYIKDTTS